MLCIHNSTTDVYFNLAVEEYLLKQVPDAAFMLWRNEPSVVVGKHQPVSMEVNCTFAEQNQIAIARRMSGGGTVYHDLGNLNFTFVEKNDRGDFRRFTDIIVELLSTLGIKAKIGERNMITLYGLKISGCAQCIHKTKMLHHGTLLFDSNLEDLSQVLKTPSYDSDYKLVRSIPSHVTNIRSHLENPMPIGEFMDRLMRAFIKRTPYTQPYTLNENDIRNINQLRDSKYLTKEWIYKTF